MAPLRRLAVTLTDRPHQKQDRIYAPAGPQDGKETEEQQKEGSRAHRRAARHKKKGGKKKNTVGRGNQRKQQQQLRASKFNFCPRIVERGGPAHGFWRHGGAYLRRLCVCALLYRRNVSGVGERTNDHDGPSRTASEGSTATDLREATGGCFASRQTRCDPRRWASPRYTPPPRQARTCAPTRGRAGFGAALADARAITRLDKQGFERRNASRENSARGRLSA